MSYIESINGKRKYGLEIRFAKWFSLKINLKLSLRHIPYWFTEIDSEAIFCNSKELENLVKIINNSCWKVFNKVGKYQGQKFEVRKFSFNWNCNQTFPTLTRTFKHNRKLSNLRLKIGDDFEVLATEFQCWWYILNNGARS